MLFKNLYENLLNEAPGDEEETNQAEEETPEAEEETPEETDDTEEESDDEEEEESDLSDEDQEFSDSEGADSELDAESDEQSDNEDSSADSDDEEAEVVGNPHAKRVYYDRFENLESLILKFLETIKRQEVHYKNDDKTEKRNREIVKYVKTGLTDTLKQLNYILVKGAITSLNIEATQKIYAKMKTKIDTYLKLYAKIMDVDL